MSAERTALLFDTIRDNNFLTEAQLEQLAVLPEAKNPDPRALGKVLLQKGWLTRFQINLLAQGKAKELMVGPYRLLDRLGEGGMGSVFKAQHQHMNRVVALKLIRKEKLNNPDAVKRFYQEVQAAAQLQHPNIALAFDAGQAGTAHFLSMEFIDGTDLARLVVEKGRLPVARACDYVRQAALGLQHAHEQGMVHRDIKPHNLMLTRNGQVKILDFGLARFRGLDADRHLTQTGVVLGTPDYLAPEQAVDSRKADIRADLYALGCTLYFLLAGRAPFQAESLTQLLLKHQMEKPRALSEVRDDVPEELEEVLNRLIAKDPEERYATPAQVAAALEPFAAGGAAPMSGTGLAATAASKPSAESWETIAEAAKGKKTGSKDGTKAQSGTRRSLAAKTDATPEDAKKKRVLLLAAGGGGAVLLGGVILAVILAFGSSPPPASTPVASNPAPTTPTPPPTMPEDPPDPKPVVPDPPPDSKPDPKPQPKPDPLTADVPRGKELAVLKMPDAQQEVLHGLAVTPDGRYFVGLSSRSHFLWDARSYELIRAHLPGNTARGLHILPDNRRFLTARNRMMLLGDVQTGDVIQEYREDRTDIKVLAVSADGRRFVTSGGVADTVNGVVVKKEGKEIWNDTNLRVRDVETGNDVSIYDRTERPVSSVALSSDGRRGFAAGLYRDGQYGVIVWDVDTGREIRRVAQGMVFVNSTIALCPDNRHLVIEAAGGKLMLWDTDTDQLVRQLEPTLTGVAGMAVSPGGRYLLTSHTRTSKASGQNVETDPAVRLWDLTTGKLIRQFDGHTASAAKVAFSMDGSKGLSAGTDKTCRVWDLTIKDPAVPVALKPVTEPRPSYRIAVPEEARLMQAEAAIKELYKDDYAKKKSSDKEALAQKLLDKGRATKDDMAARFVLLREASDVAASVPDVALALAAVADLVRDFDVNATAMRLAALTAASKVVTTPLGGRQVADAVLDAVNDALAEDDFDGVFKLTALAADLSRRMGSAVFARRVEVVEKDLHDIQKEFEKVKAARATLKEKPDDAEAKVVIGRYLCLRRGAWSEGLPYLAAGSDKAAAQAKQDLARPAAAADQGQLADGWWDVAQGEQGPARLGFLSRAAYWYGLAVRDLQGFNSERIDKRLQQIAEAEAAVYPPEPGPLPRKLLGHTGSITCVNFSADGKRAITGSDDKFARVWDTIGGRELASLDGPTAGVRGVVLSEKGQFAGIGAGDNNARWWEVDTRKKGTNVTYKTAVTGLETSPDGSLVVLGTRDGGLAAGIWKAAANPDWQPRKAQQGSVTCLAILGEDRVLAGDEGGELHWYDAGFRHEVQRFRAHKGAVLDVSASPDGKRCVTVGADKVVTVWDLTRPGLATVVRQLRGLPATVTCVAFLPDGRRFLTGGEDKMVRLWDAVSGRELMRFPGHTDKVLSLAVSPDGSRAISGGADKMALLWDVTKIP